MAFSSFLVLAALSLRVAAQVPASASAIDLESVDAQYVNTGFPSAVPVGFGVSLNATALLTVEYASGVIVNGNPYTVAEVTGEPTVYITPSTSTVSSFTASSLYTLVLADASSLGDPDTEGNYRHFLANSLTGAPTAGANETFTTSGGTVITDYATPGPIAGTGPHRYAWLLFDQPTTFAAPANLSTAGVAASHWSVSAYVASSGLGPLVAASFFTVENGTPTGSVAATSAVSTATLAGAASASSGAASSGTKSGSSSSSAAASTSTKAASSSASINVGRTSVALLAVGAGAAFFL